MTERPILAPAPRSEPIAIPDRDPVPVTLLIGFLGAGKTSLLNRILNGDHGLRVGVLVNDFGAINIDADLIEGVEENMISLTNGCVCCEIRDDLVVSLEQLLLREKQIDYVILEASGVSDPEGIVMTFLDRKFADLLRLDSITCIVDAEAIFTDGKDEDLTMLKIRQIGFSDLVVLNKVDLVTPTHVEVIEEWIGQFFKRIRIVEAVHCNVPLEILLAVGRFDPANMLKQTNDIKIEPLDSAHGHHSAGDMFQTWSFETDQPLSLERLREMVRRDLPASVYRCKGILYSVDNPEKRITLQIVGRRTKINELDEWGERTPRTKIVAIGSSDEIDPDSLTALFESCISEPSGEQLWSRLPYCYRHACNHYHSIVEMAGQHQLRMEFIYDGGGVGQGGLTALFIDGQEVGSGRVAETHSCLTEPDHTSATPLSSSAGAEVSPIT